MSALAWLAVGVGIFFACIGIFALGVGVGMKDDRQ